MCLCTSPHKGFLSSLLAMNRFFFRNNDGTMTVLGELMSIVLDSVTNQVRARSFRAQLSQSLAQ